MPALYTTGDLELFTWMQGVGNEPHIMEVPFTFPSTYPEGRVDLSDQSGVNGYSPRVVRTLKANTYMRVFVGENKRIYRQVFER
jgi:hypothetical protein